MSEQTTEVQLQGEVDVPEPAGAGREVELKLFTDPATLQLLLKAAVIARNATSKGVVRRLEATYYDTPDAVLARQGASLRVRRSGKQFVQTLKLASEGARSSGGRWKRGCRISPLSSMRCHWPIWARPSPRCPALNSRRCSPPRSAAIYRWWSLAAPSSRSRSTRER
ncbi:CYTH domain-containing protein [Ancylobacter dichloromethanicus]